ncbi:MAG: DbpA RNA binding domain-containing protein, partial [Treponema sp.]|nr:DbpA RNA binding domain-containing protein [Treponema sp.]
IGRNRRVFPRDLVGLLVGAAGLDRDRIGDIRVLANYSFVQLFAEDAEKAIAALNNYEYRGRSLSVSYSRQKDAEEDSQTTAGLDAQAAAEDAAAYAAAEKASSNEVFSAPHYSSSEEQPSDDGNMLV